MVSQTCGVPAVPPEGLGRRSFLKGAALSLFGLAVFGVASDNAYAAKASDATLAALDAAQAEYDVAVATLAQIGNELEDAQYRLSQCQAELAATEQQIADTIAAPNVPRHIRRQLEQDGFLMDSFWKSVSKASFDLVRQYKEKLV